MWLDPTRPAFPNIGSAESQKGMTYRQHVALEVMKAVAPAVWSEELATRTARDVVALTDALISALEVK